MNLRSIDLNLLVILDALLDEAHVTRAARRLALSQPATSSALERCRALFKDVLLERSAGRMRLTPKAQALRAPLKQALAGLRAALEPPAVDLKTLKRSLPVAMADVLVSVLVPSLHARLRQSAPGIDLVIRPWRSAADSLRELQQGEIDLAVSVIPEGGEDVRRLEVLRETYVVAMRAKHPAAPGFDLEKWLSYPHVLVSGRGETRGVLDEALARTGRSRRVGVVVPSFLVVPSLLEGSDLIAMLPSRLVSAARAGRLSVFKPPIRVDGFTLHAAWHARHDDDPAVQHLAREIRAALAQ
ncbi:MAG: LysR substrate-binding domain-containing protein [Gammaproteobacteria bacterium]